MLTIEVSSTPSPTLGRISGSPTSSSVGTVGPTFSKGTPLARWAAMGEKMSRPWKLDETTGNISSRFSSARLDDAAEGAGRRHEQTVVRSDEHVTARHLETDRETLGADARIHHGDVRPDGHVLEREREDRAPNGSNSAAPGD